MNKPVTQRIKLFINGKEIDNTLTSIKKNLIKYRVAADKATEGSEDWIKYNKAVAELETEFNEARAAQKAFRQDTKLTKAGIDKSQQSLTKFTSSFSTLINGYKTGDLLQVKEGFEGVKNGIKGATKATLAFLATPIGILIAGLTGIGVATKAWFDYNKAVVEALRVTTSITGLTDKEADNARIRAETLAKTFDLDFKKILETASTLSKQFDISINEAFDNVEKGLVRGQKENEEYFQSLKEYPTFFKQAGFSSTEFRRIIEAGYDLKIYKDKLPDAFKEATIEITKESEGLQKVLKETLGADFSNKLFKGFKSGTLTIKDVLSEIDKEVIKQGKSQTDLAKITEKLFISAGEDAGGALKIFEAYNLAINKNQRELTESEKITQDQIKSTNKLKQITSSLFSTGDKGWGLLIDKAKLFGTKILIKILETGVDVYNWVVDLNNESGVFSAILSSLGKTATASFRVIGILLSNVWDGFKSLGNIIEGIFTFNPDKIKEGFTKGFSILPNLVKDIKNEVVKDANEIYDAFSGKNKMKRLSIGDFTSDNTTSTSDTLTTTTDESSPDGELTEEDKKIIASKKKLKEWLDTWEEDNKFQKEIKDLEEDLQKQAIEEQKLEEKFSKLEQEANGEKELLTRLETAKQAELQAIKDKWAKVALAKLDLKAKKEAELEKKKTLAQKQAADREKLLQKQRVAGYANMFGNIAQLLGKNTAAGKAAATAQATINTYQGVSEVWASKSVLPEPFATAQKVISTGVVLASGLQTVKQINSTKTPSLDQGGYTFSGPYSGGMDGIGGQLAMIHPDEYMIPKPVMQMPETPMIVEYLEAKRTGKPVPSFADGGPVSELPIPIPKETSIRSDNFLVNVLEKLYELLDEGLSITYTLEDERKRRSLAKKLDNTIKASKN